MQLSGVATFFQRLFHLRRMRSRFESPRYLFKWFCISASIGVVAGIGALVFFLAIQYSSQFFLGCLVGYVPPEPSGEGTANIMSLWSAARPWLLPVITTFGGLVSGIIVFTFAPEAEGHGTDAAIAAFHDGRPIRSRIPLVKLVASAIMIGSGGSGGREGPTAQISAGFGSLLGHFLRLDTQDRRIALAIGIGSGIGAIFRAPLGGAILAAEILYKRDLEIEALIPAFIASIIGYSIFGSWFGWSPIFATSGSLTFSSPPQLLYYVVLGLLCGGIGLLYARGFYGLTHFFHRLPLPNWLKPAIGGLSVGLIGLVLPQALGMGYGWVQVSMGTGLLSLPLWVILLLPFAKILTTGLSIGSGGSGGIFGPGMVIGGMVGAVVWRLSYHVLPDVPDAPAPFVIIAMMALFGSIAHAPLAVMLMVAEMTGNLSLLAPAMIAVGIASIIVGDESIYSSQINSRADSPAHRLSFSFPLLSTLAVRQAMTQFPVFFQPQQSVGEAQERLEQEKISGSVVLDERGKLLGALTFADIERIPFDQRATRHIDEAMNRDVFTVTPDDTLDVALDQLTSHRRGWMPVVDNKELMENKHVIGRISAPTIMHTYRRILAEGSRRTHGLIEGTAMIEIEVKPDIPFAGHSLRETDFPPGSLVVSIRRQNEFLFPTSETVIEPGDQVTFLVSPAGEARLREYLSTITPLLQHGTR